MCRQGERQQEKDFLIVPDAEVLPNCSECFPVFFVKENLRNLQSFLYVNRIDFFSNPLRTPFYYSYNFLSKEEVFNRDNKRQNDLYDIL